MAAGRRGGEGGLPKLLLALALAAPLLVFLAVAGVRTGLWDWPVGYSLLTMRVGVGLAALGALAALGSIVVAMHDRRAWPWVGATVVVSCATLALYAQHLRATDYAAYAGTAAPAFQATTDRAEPPVFSTRLQAVRAGAGAEPAVLGAGYQDCDAASLPTQAAPGAAAYALEQAGFDVLGFGVGRADGSLSTFWFQFGYDATIRIRPGQTDVRVAAREARPDGDEACRLVRRIVAELQPGR